MKFVPWHCGTTAGRDLWGYITVRRYRENGTGPLCIAIQDKDVYLVCDTPNEAVTALLVLLNEQEKDTAERDAERIKQHNEYMERQRSARGQQSTLTLEDLEL